MTEDKKREIARQFTESGHRVDHLMTMLYGEGLDSGAVIGGALTTVIHHLIELSPDQKSAMAMLGTAMQSASLQSEILDEVGKPDLH